MTAELSPRPMRGHAERMALPMGRLALEASGDDCRPPPPLGRPAQCGFTPSWMTPLPIGRDSPKASSLPPPLTGDRSWAEPSEDRFSRCANGAADPRRTRRYVLSKSPIYGDGLSLVHPPWFCRSLEFIRRVGGRLTTAFFRGDLRVWRGHCESP